MAFSLAVILLPLAIVSILRSQAVISQTEARNKAALFGETVQVASTELALIDKARGVAGSVGAIVLDLLQQPEVCSAALGRIAERSNLGFVGFLAADGSVPCASPNSPAEMAVTDDFAAALSDPREIVRRRPMGFASDSPVIYVLSPVFDRRGGTLGYVTASIPQEMVLENRNLTIPGAQFVTVNTAGEILTTSLPVEEAQALLPSYGLPQRFLDSGGSFSATSDNGDATIYAVSPVVQGEISMVGIWADQDASASIFYLQRAAFFPLVMWLASLVVGWFVVDFLVTRHVTSLGFAMRGFAKNRRTELPPSFNAAPVELRDFGDAYITLTDAVVRDEAKLEDALYQKNILLREVHHRVKNNLQLIASIMAMQMRRTQSDEVKEVMAGLQDRVLSLATIHKSLYQTSGLAAIRLDELLSDIVEQMQGLSQHAKSVVLETDYDPVSLLPDQAVPFSLLVTEALTNAHKYISAAPGAPLRLKIALKDQGEQRVGLMIENSRGGPGYKKSDPHSTGLGAQLMTAFATQLGSEMEVEATPAFYRLSLSFTAAPLPAEDLPVPRDLGTQQPDQRSDDEKAEE
ncbi:MAG: sensor histidine kinase [Pseudomonadota bacterium]